MMKKLLSIIMCALMLIAALASCAPAKSDSQSSSADETAKYTAYLEEHLESTPERKPASLVIETADRSTIEKKIVFFMLSIVTISFSVEA